MNLGNIGCLKMVNPNYLVAYGSIDNCSTNAMVTRITFICNLIKGAKTTIKYIMGKGHFKWLINYKPIPM